MKKIELSEIKNIIEYEKIRQDFRDRIIAMKRARRLTVGERLTLTFENRYTVTFQIEEMIRIERMIEDGKIGAEVETYNELIPRENELSATLFVEVDEQDQVKPVLDSLVGLNKDSLYLRIGSHDVPAVFEEGHATDDRISAVQYVRFKLSPEDVGRVGDLSSPMEIIVRHENYKAQAQLPAEMRKSLSEDFVAGANVNVWN